MSTLYFETTIHAPIKSVFNLIENITEYDRWLTSSGLYEAVVEVSENPVREGTTYVDKGVGTNMIGRIAAYQPPECITFYQQTRVKLLGLLPAGLDVTIAYTLKAVGEKTQVQRQVTVATSGPLNLARNMLIKRVTAESQRILEAMKTYLERAG